MPTHIIYRNKTKKGRKRPHNHIRHYESGRKTSVNKHIPIPKRYKKITKHQFLYSDFDRDGVKNKDDCYPFDKNMHKEIKESMKEYMKEYRKRPEVKAIAKEYRQRPEVKAKHKEYHKEYYQKNKK